jgi:hypothetical protein
MCDCCARYRISCEPLDDHPHVLVNFRSLVRSTQSTVILMDVCWCACSTGCSTVDFKVGFGSEHYIHLDAKETFVFDVYAGCDGF